MSEQTHQFLVKICTMSCSIIAWYKFTVCFWVVKRTA